MTLKTRFVLPLFTGFLLTQLFPFLFGTRIYTQNWWRIMAPSSILLGPAGRVTILDKIVSTCLDSVIFAIIIFAFVSSFEMISPVKLKNVEPRSR